MPQTPDAIMDDVFITPRVLDDGAFSSYADSLRRLIRDAEERGTRLGETATDTKRLCETIREAAKKLQERTTLGGQIAELLGERTSQAETLIDRLASSMSDEQELERLADAVIEKRRSAFERRLSESLAGLLARYGEAEQRAEQAEQRAALAERALEEGERRLAELEPRVAELVGRVRGVIEEAERSVGALTASLENAVTRAQSEQDRLTGLVTEAVEGIKRAGAVSLDQAEQDIDAIRLRSVEMVRETEEGADRAVSHALEAIEQLRTLAADLSASTDQDAAALESRLGPFRGMLERAEAVIGDGERPGALTGAIERAEALRVGLENTAPSLVEDVERAETSKRRLEEMLETADERLRAMEERRRAICERLEREVEELGGDLSPIERAAAGLRLRLADLEKRTQALGESLAGQSTPELGQLRARVEEITSAALQRTEEAGMWLVGLIKHAEQVRAEQAEGDASTG